jgi:AcrR family transcriptional regulator
VDEGSSVRWRRHVALMRRVQSVALDLFEARGFEGVTIEEIAARADVSAPTVYRKFGTKEGIVLWDEYDPMLLAAVAERLRVEPIALAVRRALVSSLDRVYAADSDRILRRARLMANVAALRAANSAAMAATRRDLAKVLVDAAACADDLEADVVAAALVGTLEVAVDHWVRSEGKRSLRNCFDGALRRLARFASTRETP